MNKCLRLFHPLVVCEYRHSRHIPCFLLCACPRLSRHCTSALPSSASCIPSTLGCQFKCKSIFDICESIQNLPRLIRNSSKNRLFFPPLQLSSFIVNASSFTIRSFIILAGAHVLLDACICVCLVGIAFYTDINIGCDYFHTSVYISDIQIPPTLYIQSNFVQ